MYGHGKRVIYDNGEKKAHGDGEGRTQGGGKRRQREALRRRGDCSLEAARTEAVSRGRLAAREAGTPVCPTGPRMPLDGT